MTSQIDQGAVESVPGTDITSRRTGQGRQSVLFVHGYLDSHAIWDDVIASLNTPGAEFVTLDLAGMGDRADASVQRPRQRPITRQPHARASASTERAQHKDVGGPGQRPAHPVRRF